MNYFYYIYFIFIMLFLFYVKHIFTKPVFSNPWKTELLFNLEQTVLAHKCADCVLIIVIQHHT